MADTARFPSLDDMTNYIKSGVTGALQTMRGLRASDGTSGLNPGGIAAPTAWAKGVQLPETAGPNGFQTSSGGPVQVPSNLGRGFRLVPGSDALQTPLAPSRAYLPAVQGTGLPAPINANTAIEGNVNRGFTYGGGDALDTPARPIATPKQLGYTPTETALANPRGLNMYRAASGGVAPPPIQAAPTTTLAPAAEEAAIKGMSGRALGGAAGLVALGAYGIPKLWNAVTAGKPDYTGTPNDYDMTDATSTTPATTATYMSSENFNKLAPADRPFRNPLSGAVYGVNTPASPSAPDLSTAQALKAGGELPPGSEPENASLFPKTPEVPSAPAMPLMSATQDANGNIIKSPDWDAANNFSLARNVGAKGAVQAFAPRGGLRTSDIMQLSDYNASHGIGGSVNSPGAVSTDDRAASEFNPTGGLRDKGHYDAAGQWQPGQGAGGYWDRLAEAKLANLGSEGGLHAAQAEEARAKGLYFGGRNQEAENRVAALTEKNAQMAEAARQKDLTHQQQITAAAEKPELAAVLADPKQAEIYHAVGGNLPDFKLAQSIATEKGLTYKPAESFKAQPFFRPDTKGSPGTFVDTSGKPVDMNSILNAVKAKKAGA